MADGQWSWWVGHSEERYHTECGSREEAVRIATEEQDGGYICEAQQSDDLRLSRYFTADRLVEHAEEGSYDDFGDPEGDVPIFDVSSVLGAELEKRVRATIDEWQDDHGLKFKAWRFSAQRNEEYIPAPADP